MLLIIYAYYMPTIIIFIRNFKKKKNVLKYLQLLYSLLKNVNSIIIY